MKEITKEGENERMKKQDLKMFVGIGMFGSIAFILMLLNFPLPPFPSFLNVDLSDVPALLAAIIFGPVAGILVELVKNVLDFVITGSETGIPIGHIANFVAGVTFVLPTYYIYNKMSSKKGLIIGLVTSTICMAIFMSFMNFYVFLPAYGMLGGFGAQIKYVAAVILPFNIIKGLMMSVVFVLLFSRLRVWIKKMTPAKLGRA